MASTGVDYSSNDIYRGGEKEITTGTGKPPYDYDDVEGKGRRASVATSVKTVYDSTHRKLKQRHIQLIGIGGTIGTALYVQIGRGLLNGGPASLFIAFTLWYVWSGLVYRHAPSQVGQHL